MQRQEDATGRFKIGLLRPAGVEAQLEPGGRVCGGLAFRRAGGVVSLLAGVRAARSWPGSTSGPTWEGPGCSAQSGSLGWPEAGRGEATPDLTEVEPSRRQGPAVPALPRPKAHADGDQDASGTRHRRLRGRGWDAPVRGLGAGSQAAQRRITQHELVAMQLPHNVTSNKNTIIFL